MTDGLSPSLNPSITVSDFLHVVWEELFNRISYNHSTHGGASWDGDTALYISYGPLSPSVSVSGQVVHVVWFDNSGIFYKRSTNGGLIWGTDIRLTNNLASSVYPSIASSGPAVHIVWVDNRDLNSEIYYKRSTNVVLTGKQIYA
jgi:hypothetical protein